PKNDPRPCLGSESEASVCRSVDRAEVVPRPAKPARQTLRPWAALVRRAVETRRLRNEALTLRKVCRAGFCRPRHAVGPVHRAALSPSVPTRDKVSGRSLAARGLEADLGGLALGFTAELEELARREAERAGDQVRGKLRDARIQVAHHRVVVAARVLHRVLDLAEARLQLREVLRGAQLRVGL